MLEHKIAEAKATKRKRFFTLIITTIAISLVCVLAIVFPSYYQNHLKDTESVIPETVDDAGESVVSDKLSNEKFRQSYIELLGEYENNIEPQLNKINLIKWDKKRSDKLSILKEEALSKFSIAEYANAYNKLVQAKQLAESIIVDSQNQFAKALSRAQQAYNLDDYKNADEQIKTAIMLDSQSEEAYELSNKIKKLSEILPLLEKARTARIENNNEKELALLEDIIKISPERTSSIERKNVLIDLIANKNFKLNITRSYTAIERADTTAARKNLSNAKKIFPDRSEIRKVALAIEELESKQRFEKYQQAAQKAMKNDDWLTAKQQLELALKERQGDASILASLTKATSIIKLKTDFDQLLARPYSLSNELVSANANQRITEAKAYADVSPDLNAKAGKLELLITRMNNKVPVEVISDNETNVLVRGVGIVGKTQLKTIQLKPGQYKFEGKREGYKSKLIDVLIPYDKPASKITVICDEPI